MAGFSDGLHPYLSVDMILEQGLPLVSPQESSPGLGPHQMVVAVRSHPQIHGHRLDKARQNDHHVIGSSPYQAPDPWTPRHENRGRGRGTGPRMALL